MGSDVLNPEEWDRQPFERSRAYAAFCVYRDLGAQRSLQAVSEKIGKTRSLLSQWSRKWEWVKRVEAWDNHLDGIALKEQEEAAKQAKIEMTRRHLNIAKALQAVSAAGINHLNEVARAKDNKLDLSPMEISKMAELGVKLERLIEGETTESIQENHTGAVVVRLPAKSESKEAWARAYKAE